ncbi:hypothetical protein HY948_00780 [Candidatus Gottesmanbacteria bacterium]|nr:hypothetical protein [Candidatus Gottesmanbacteria bacterium]
MSAFTTTAQHIRRSPYQAAAAILTLFVTFLLTGIFFLSVVASAFILQYFEGKPQITVFFADKATKEDADALTKKIEATGKTSSIKFVSKDDALLVYREQNKNDPLLLEMVTADILPASLEISATDPKFLADLEPLIKDAQGVEEVVYQKDVVDTLIIWTNAIRWVGGILTGLLTFNSILIIMTVISMKIALRRDEIDILRLIGASPWYIRMPFILEGGLYGLIGSFGSWLIITALIVWLRPALLAFLGVIPIIQEVLVNAISMPFLLSSGGFLAGMLLSGLLLGSLGSLIALGRYLKL